MRPNIIMTHDATWSNKVNLRIKNIFFSIYMDRMQTKKLQELKQINAIITGTIILYIFKPKFYIMYKLIFIIVSINL
jgi:hypothetical protein